MVVFFGEIECFYVYFVQGFTFCTDKCLWVCVGDAKETKVIKTKVSYIGSLSAEPKNYISKGEKTWDWETELERDNQMRSNHSKLHKRGTTKEY